MNNQRSEYRRWRANGNKTSDGKDPNMAKTSMTKERIAELEAMGFCWNVRESRTPWSARLDELIAYKKE